jgi:hypothetical protein
VSDIEILVNTISNYEYKLYSCLQQSSLTGGKHSIGRFDGNLDGALGLKNNYYFRHKIIIFLHSNHKLHSNHISGVRTISFI